MPGHDLHAAHAAYHAHLDRCARCREKPFDQCPVGQGLLVAAATGRTDEPADAADAQADSP